MSRAEPRLVEAARRGNVEALERLLVICQPDMRRFARRACATREDAEDAVQLALWQLYRRIGALRTVGSLTAWLFKIVQRECHRLLRSQRASIVADPASDWTAHRDLLPSELRKDLVAAIASLPEIYRAVFILRDIDELTASEVADRLEISIDAAKSRLHRARAMMKEHLLTHGYLSSP